jgi:FkbM family methyltransferase
MNPLKHGWHRLHYWLALWRLRQSGDPVLRSVAKGKAFQSIFSGADTHSAEVQRLEHHIVREGIFNKVSIDGVVIFWPVAASMRALWMVLAEILLPDHPHYYDSPPTVIGEGDVVLDIGACEGAFALTAARKAAKVIAVEPSRVMQEGLSMSAECMRLSNFVCVEALLGAEQGEVGFFDNSKNPLNGKVAPLGECSYTVPSMTLDDLCAKHAPDGLTYIKCDAEGQDVEIIKSGKKALDAWRPKLAVATYHAPDHFSELRVFLEKCGYEVAAQGLHYDAVTHTCFPLLLKARHPNAEIPLPIGNHH